MKRSAAILAFAGLILLAYCAFVYIQAWRFQAREKHRHGKDTHTKEPRKPDSALSGPPGSSQRALPSRGQAVAVLTIPRIGLSAVVIEGADARELKLGPGHIPHTPFPGEGGNFSIAGHRDTFFRPLRAIRADDIVKIESGEREYRYRVVSTRIVEPTDIHVIESTGRDTLTLVTCYPFNFVGPAPKRFIVHADCESCAEQAAR